MQNSETILYNLSKHASNKDYEFKRLYRLLYNKDLYYKAIAKIYKNKGSGTKGVTEETIDGFGEEKIDFLIEVLKNEKYQPKPARRTYIPKKNGEKRPLGIPDFSDRVIQEICRMIIDTIYEPMFSKSSHGFRENKSCHSALYEIDTNFQGSTWFIEGDIEGYFDNIDHHVLIDILKRKIKDEKFIRLIWKFLRAGYIENWKYNNTYSGTPQGGIISPLLANIYLNELDEYIENELKPNFDIGKPRDKKRNTEYRKYEMRNCRLKKKIDEEQDKSKREEMIREYKENKKILLTLPYYESHSDRHKVLKYVRYADDFLIGVVGSKKDCFEIKQEISNFLKEKLKIKLSEEKTLITHTSKEAIFLGYAITISNDLATKKDKNGITKRSFNRVVKLNIPNNTIEKIIIKNRMVRDIDAKEWKILHRPELQGLSDLEIISTYNSELRGLYNYYSIAQNVPIKMWQLRYVMEYSCLKTLAGKYKTSISKLKKKYRVGKEWGIEYETKKGKKIVTFYKSFNRNKKPLHSLGIDNKPNNYIYQCTTELESRLKADECEICGTNEGKFELHHINKVKNLKGKAFWEKIMIAKKRKTLVVCIECHKKIHGKR